MTLDEHNQAATPADTTDVVEAWDDFILHADADGLVTATCNRPPAYLPRAKETGVPFWESLALDTSSLAETLQTFPPHAIHERTLPDDRSFLLRIIELTGPQAPSGGFVIVATDNRPMEALYESYEERLEDNISGWADSITLFNALFDTAKDATFLMDESGTILAANTAAQRQHDKSEQGLGGGDILRLLGKRFHAGLRRTMKSLSAGESRTEHIVALDGDGEPFPAEATLRRIAFTDYSLYQLILHDLSTHIELEENLQESQAQVEARDIALKEVLRTVEEDRRELREQLTTQVRKQMLPALERITTSDTAEVREGYKTVIEDQLEDLAGEIPGQFDAEILKLSPREMEVCHLIQIGRSGKEIAQLLNMSFETVQTHRKNIRRKLGLRGKKTSLFTYLRQKPSLA